MHMVGKPAPPKLSLVQIGCVIVLLLAFSGAAGASAGKGGKPRSRDTTAPTVAISSPQAGATLSGPVGVVGSASDNVLLAKVEVSVDGGAYQAAQGTTSWTYQLDTSGLPDGAHTISARATDTSGNQSVAAVSVTLSSDVTPPTITISSPAAGALLSGTASIAGSASDNKQVARVDVAVDKGTYALANGTSDWQRSIDTTAYSNGSHIVFARATDAAGNITTTSTTVTVGNFVDSTPPSVAISAPAPDATLLGTVMITGSASDDVQASKVELSVDGGPYRTAQGTDSWSYALDTTALANGSHSLTARATDSSGNTATTAESVTVQNPSSLPAGVAEQMVTPEGATIQIYSGVSGWTAQQLYDILRPNAYQLDLIGPDLTIKVQTQYASSTATSAGTGGGLYTSYHATIYLNASPGTVFPDRPDDVIAHEYGHAWTMYHLYLTQQGDWTSWLTARGLLGDPRVDSSYVWSKNEMIADDYRMLFGTPTAISEASYINPYTADPRTVDGLKDFFVNVWGV